MPTLTIVQISDLHLFADPNSEHWGLDGENRLDRVLERIRGERAQVVLLTGDLVHDETAAGYQRLAGKLRALDCPALCLPGNHDDPELMTQHLGAGANRVLGTHDLGGWRVILLDSRIAGKDAGYLAGTELRRLEQALEEAPDRPAVIALHHQPVPCGSAWLDHIGLQNSAALLDVLTRYPQVRIVTWGHIHQPFDTQWQDVRMLGCPAVSRAFTPHSEHFAQGDAGPGYRVLELFADGRCSTRTVLLEAAPQ